MIKRELLQAGDVLLYRGTGVYGFVIRVKTWHQIGHVEVYHGHGVSAASRDGQGVNIYPLREDKLCNVLRPNVPFRVSAADRFVASMRGTPYGWWDLANFTGWHVDAKGIVCSPFATLDLRAGGVPVFNSEPANLIAPFQFLLSEHLTDITSDIMAAPVLTPALTT